MRAIIPDGAIRKASPNAAAACGTDSNGEIRCWMRRNSGVPAKVATKKSTTPSETAVVARPLPRLIIAEDQIPGSSNSWRKWPRLNPTPPSAGR